MTKEEKLQAYDEALKRVQPLYQQAKMDNNPIASTYEYLFPELAESEDERIRKWIIEEFKIHYDFESPSLNPMVVKAMIWLEKQKEQKLKEPDWCHHKVDLSGCSEEYMKAYYDGWNNCNQQHSQCEAEKKPIEWSEEDEKMFDDIILSLPRMAKGSIEILPSVAESYAERLKSLKPQYHWKPSEEQMEALERASMNKYLSAKQFDILVSLYEQLKKLM